MIIVLVVLLAAGFFLFVGPYNGLVKLRNQIQESWRQVDVELNRRYDLIPNLIETVKGYAQFERGTLENIVNLRGQARALSGGGASDQRAEVEGALSGALANVIATAEAYPELKSDANFRQLSSQLVETEDRIANGRRYYNALVSGYNTKIEAFPSNLVANMGRFEKAGYFEITDANRREAPQVSFEDMSGIPSTSHYNELPREERLGNTEVDPFGRPTDEQ